MWFAERVGKRLPVRELPGASAAAQGQRARRSAACRRLGSALLALIGIAAVAGGITGNRWWITAALAALILAWWWRPAADPSRWDRGAHGEVATARLLAQLPRRFVVLHDRRQLTGEGNLDHLIIGPTGVWIVDSKERRARLRIHRGRVWAGEWPIDVAPVIKQAGSVARVLGLPVLALVAVHGEGLRRRGKKVSGVRVLPAARLACHVRRRRRGRRLSKRDIVALAGRAERLFPPC